MRKWLLVRALRLLWENRQLRRENSDLMDRSRKLLVIIRKQRAKLNLLSDQLEQVKHGLL